VQLVYFASVRESLGLSQESYGLPEGITNVAQLISHMRSRGDKFAAAFSDSLKLRVAVNQVHAQADQLVKDEDEIAFFPPVTGG